MFILLILWIIFIFICTCTSDVHALFENFNISFSFTLTPDWSNIFQLNSPENVSLFEITGHFLLFFVLTCLLLEVFSEKRLVIVIAIIFAIFTEFLQPFFGRGADVYDVAADVIGVFTAVGLVSIRYIFYRWVESK